MPIQYVTDDIGNPTAVVVPIDEWDALLSKIGAIEPKGSRKNNFTFSHAIFRSSSTAPQSRNPRKSVAIPVVSLNRRSQI